MAEVNVVQAGYQTNTDFAKVDKSSKVSGGEASAANVKAEITRAEATVSKTEQASSTRATQSVENQAELDNLVENLNRQLEKLQNYLRFERDDESQRMVVFIKDSATDEIIRQVPAQEILEISKNITQFLEAQQNLSQDNANSSSLVGIFANQTV